MEREKLEQFNPDVKNESDAESKLLEILACLEGILSELGANEQDIKVIKEAIEKGNNKEVGKMLELLKNLKEKGIVLNDNIYKISIEPILVEIYVNSIESNGSLSPYWNDRVLETWSDKDIVGKKRDSIKSLLTRLLKEINENGSVLSDYFNKDEEITQRRVSRLENIGDVLSKYVLNPEWFLQTDREFRSMWDYVDNAELHRIVKKMLERLKIRGNLEKISPEDNEKYINEQKIEELRHKFYDYFTLLDDIYSEELNYSYFLGEIKKLERPIESLMKSSIAINGKLGRDIFKKFLGYPEFYEIIIDNIGVFQIESDDIINFFYSLIQEKGFRDKKMAKRALLYLFEKIDNFSGLDIPDGLYMELYFALYPIEELGDDAPSKDDLIDDRIKYCIKNLGKMRRHRGYLDLEFQDFVNSLKTTQYWTSENCKVCLDEAEKREEIGFIFDNYALGYFLKAIDEHKLYELSLEESLKHLPIFTDTEIISEISDILSEYSNILLLNYEADQSSDLSMKSGFDFGRFSFIKKYFLDCFENHENALFNLNLKCLELMKNRKTIDSEKRGKIQASN